MVTGSDNLDSYEALWFVSCECTIKPDGLIDDVLRELAELLGQVKPPVATREEIEKSGVTVAALFFKNVFGEQAQKALDVFVALRYSMQSVYLLRVLMLTDSQCDRVRAVILIPGPHIIDSRGMP